MPTKTTTTPTRPTRGPQKKPTKQMITIRLDRHVLAAFRAHGQGWQRMINETLNAHLPPAPPKRRKAAAKTTTRGAHRG